MALPAHGSQNHELDGVVLEAKKKVAKKRTIVGVLAAVATGLMGGKPASKWLRTL